MKKRLNSSGFPIPIVIVCLVTTSFLITACGSTGSEVESQPEPAQIVTTITETPAEKAGENVQDQIICDTPPPSTETANYTVTFNAVWSADSHPGSYVSSAHFSPFIAYSHNEMPEARIFTTASSASPGIEQIAETGATTLLEQEIMNLITTGSAMASVKGQAFNSPGEDKANLEFSQNFSHITFVSMIAPSPDWFVSAEADLLVEGQWVTERVLELASYDAGTDSGPELTSADVDTNPKETVAIFQEYLQHLGTITLIRILPDS